MGWFKTRSDVAKSLNVSTSTALRLLQQLVSKGLVNRKGERGGSKYYLASK
ncbi:MAG: helix-turn-helix domain-containing protein [Thermotogaceae bacterium]|nr:helix-turn-helix domain-containing protein [Thermotogaceae bacterium]